MNEEGVLRMFGGWGHSDSNTKDTWNLEVAPTPWIGFQKYNNSWRPRWMCLVLSQDGLGHPWPLASIMPCKRGWGWVEICTLRASSFGGFWWLVNWCSLGHNRKLYFACLFQRSFLCASVGRRSWSCKVLIVRWLVLSVVLVLLVLFSFVPLWPGCLRSSAKFDLDCLQRKAK